MPPCFELPTRWPATRWRFAGLASAFVLLLLGCGSERAPTGYGPLALGEREHCPSVNGRFDASEPLVRWSVVELVLPYDSTRPQVALFSLLGNADRSLRLVAWSGGVPKDTVRLTRDAQYRCAAGRLVLDLPESLPEEVREAITHPEGRLVRANRLSLALGAEGALVADLAHESYNGVSVWCGDGCTYVPLPFSARTTHTWTRAYPMRENGDATPDRATGLRARQRLERLRAEERALEEGRPRGATGAQSMRRSRAEAAERAIERGEPPGLAWGVALRPARPIVRTPDPIGDAAIWPH
jgi:hypothetical protein